MLFFDGVPLEGYVASFVIYIVIFRFFARNKKKKKAHREYQVTNDA